MFTNVQCVRQHENLSYWLNLDDYYGWHCKEFRYEGGPDTITTIHWPTMFLFVSNLINRFPTLMVLVSPFRYCIRENARLTSMNHGNLPVYLYQEQYHKCQEYLQRIYLESFTVKKIGSFRNPSKKVRQMQKASK